jgi:hypothetical protein
LYSCKLFWKKYISRLKIERETYWTTKRGQMNYGNFLITSFVFFYFSLSLSILSLSILWNLFWYCNWYFVIVVVETYANKVLNTWDHYFWKKTSSVRFNSQTNFLLIAWVENQFVEYFVNWLKSLIIKLINFLA